MATYSRSSHNLTFSETYDALLVLNSQQQVVATHTFPATDNPSPYCTGQEVTQLNVDDNNFIITSGECNSALPFGFDPTQSQVEFDGQTAISGGVIIDLRDIGSPAPVSITFNITNCTLSFYYANESAYTMVMCAQSESCYTIS